MNGSRLPKTDCVLKVYQGKEFYQLGFQVCWPWKFRVTCHLNSKIHACIDSIRPHSIEDMNIDHFIGNLDSDVWKAMCAQLIKDADISNIRKVKCVCVLIYTTNIAVLISSAHFPDGCYWDLEAQVDSLKLLNHLGMCTSVDTYICLLCTKGWEGSHKELQNVLTLVSADNLDFVQAMQRCTVGSSSQNGVALQCR